MRKLVVTPKGLLIGLFGSEVVKGNTMKHHSEINSRHIFKPTMDRESINAHSTTKREKSESRGREHERETM